MAPFSKRTDWVDYPNLTTPVMAADLLRLEVGIDESYYMEYMIEGATNKIFTATERTKLAGIENNATADQTGAEIKVLYEAELDTNAFTDAEKAKLAGLSNPSGASGSFVSFDNKQVTVVDGLITAITPV